MNTIHDDVEARLTDLLERSATHVDPEPDLEGALRGETLVALTDHPVRTRRRITRALGAAAAALALVAGTAVAVTSGDDGEPVATEGPTAPAPAASDPAGPGGTVVDATVGDPLALPHPIVDADLSDYATVSGSYAMADERTTPGPVAVIGRSDGDAVLDPIVVRTFEGTPWWVTESATGSVAVSGIEPDVLTLPSGTRVGFDTQSDATVVAVPGAVTVVLEGKDPLALLEMAPEAISARLVDGGIDLTIDSDLITEGEEAAGVEPGLTVVEEPAPLPVRSWPMVGAEASDPFRLLQVQVPPTSALASIANLGDARATTVGGAPGYVVELDGATHLAWTTPEGTTVVVGAMLDPAATQAIAESVRLVDAQVWGDHYDLDPDAASKSVIPFGEGEIPAPPS